jgi:hypothetical protein
VGKGFQKSGEMIKELQPIKSSRAAKKVVVASVLNMRRIFELQFSELLFIG